MKDYNPYIFFSLSYRSIYTLVKIMHGQQLSTSQTKFKLQESRFTKKKKKNKIERFYSFKIFGFLSIKNES